MSCQPGGSEADFPVYAQTNLQLYGQMRNIGYADDDILFVQRVYDYVGELYCRQMMASGRPFVCHLVGTASVLAELSMPPMIVAAGLIHTRYRRAFLDEEKRTVPDALRQQIEAELGAELERYVFQFSQMRRKYNSIRQRLATIDAMERDIIIMLLADELEKLSSLSVLYCYRLEERLIRCARKAPDMIGLSLELGLPSLSAEFAYWTNLVSEIKLDNTIRPVGFALP